ncbi:MAG: DUF167 domain-containing protein [Candidatus Sumerlaeaceae bacterium]|nr:DUF167 domain-containing protein [Candidatus Sumerlaeaceae bacterium]
MSRILTVRAHPRSHVEKVEVRGPDEFEVWTRALPDKGAANTAIARQLAKHLGLPPSSVVLKRGGASRMKQFEVL